MESILVASSATIADPGTSTPAVSEAGSWDGRAVFIKNMAALWRNDARLAQRIDEVSDDRRLPVIVTKSGRATVRMKTCKGETLLHSRYDPEAEARKLIDSTKLRDNFCFVVNGFGLGYHILELHARLKGDACIVVSEPSLTLLSTALSCVDLSAVIASGQLVILTELDKATVHEYLKPHATLIMLGAQFVIHPASQQVAKEFHAEARKQITDYITYSRMTLLTLVGNAQATCRNIAHNLPTYMSTPPINVLRDRFKGCPAIVISGGPSLRRNIDLLVEAKGKAVLIATQTLFKPLLARGIVPDFVTSLDFHSISQQFFHGVTDFRDVHLVAEPKVNWHVLDQYDSPVSLLHSSFAEDLLGPELAARDGLKPGASVAHLAFYLAEYLGCDPIVFVGQDLAFTGHSFYVPGVEVHSTWRGEINRFNSMETKEWERIVRNRSILRKTVDVRGNHIYTDDLLFTYLEQFERDFVASRAKIVNATEGGARMRGAEALTLRETLDRFCAQPIESDRFNYRQTCNWNDVSRLPAVREQIDVRIREVEQLGQVCEEMLGLLHELQDLAHDPSRFNARLVRVDELRTVVHRCRRAYALVNAAGQLAELQRFTADRKLEAGDDVGPERAVRQLTRDVRYVSSVRDGVTFVTEMLKETLARIDARIGGDQA